MLEDRIILEDKAATDRRLGEILDWAQMMFINDELEGLVVMTVKKEPGGTIGAVRSVLFFEEHQEHIKTLMTWCRKARVFHLLGKIPPGGNA